MKEVVIAMLALLTAIGSGARLSRESLVTATPKNTHGDAIDGGGAPVPLTVISAILPTNILSREPIDIHPSSPEVVAQILKMQFPPLSDANKLLTTDQVIEIVTGRVVVRVPPKPRPSKDDEKQKIFTYADDYLYISTTKQNIGRFLAGRITGDTEVGEAETRMNSMRPATETEVIEKTPLMIDIVIITDRYLVITAMPAPGW